MLELELKVKLMAQARTCLLLNSPETRSEDLAGQRELVRLPMVSPKSSTHWSVKREVAFQDPGGYHSIEEFGRFDHLWLFSYWPAALEVTVM